MRLPAAIALVSLLAACAGSPGVRSEGAPKRVVVVTASRVQAPEAGSVSGQLLGEEEPRDVMASEAKLALRSRGFDVLEVRTALGAEPEAGQAEALARQSGAEAAVVMVLTRMDLSALKPLGRAEVELETRLLANDGRTLWSGTRRHATSVKTYRAQTDWRSHLRQAVSKAAREVP
jgi:uncharacterized membrane-anchored protein